MLNIELRTPIYSEDTDFDDTEQANGWMHDHLTDEEIAVSSILLVSDDFIGMMDLVESHLRLVDARFEIDIDKSEEQNEQVFDMFFNAVAELDRDIQEKLIHSLAIADNYAKYDPFVGCPVGRGIGFEYLCYIAKFLRIVAVVDTEEFLTFQEFIDHRISNLKAILASLSED